MPPLPVLRLLPELLKVHANLCLGITIYNPPLAALINY